MPFHCSAEQSRLLTPSKSLWLSLMLATVELVDDVVTGFIVPPRDAHTFADPITDAEKREFEQVNRKNVS